MYDVFTFSPDSILIVDASMDLIRITDMNDAFCEWSGYRKDSLLGTTPSQLIELEQVSNPFERLEGLSQSVSSASPFYCKFRSRNGIMFEVRLEVLRIGQSDTQLKRYAVVFHDVTEQRWIDSIIREEKAVGAAILTRDHAIQWVSSYVTPVRHEQSAFLNQQFHQYVSINDRRHVKRSLDYASANRTPQPCSFSLVHDDEAYLARAIFMSFQRWNGSVRSHAVVMLQMEPLHTDVDSSAKLRLLMTAKNISVTELARSTHISLTTISKIRNGKIKKPKRMTAELIASQLGVVPEAIWGAYHVSYGGF
ncbi:PAS domain S-box-containing protein [Paenibacillus cellulosilyticus]|uniref:PAS domain S-box-containing protein n=1 Tax=Paenibacillus cellulosilyticus TaxID=375489 RepID=A0A2V2YQV9_9BACL|nr:helix-turn-helix domain-containing protein [Paenibacillus cellulosilyticus]PWV97288.1 PAS domain S-box-containing protein [Paenibacillus cellulosilyticus]QKS47507.1 helix-turn-helix domain-containing protein [Paenibacillus cellulosilyticus]